MAKSNNLSRRDFLRLTAMASAGAVVAGIPLSASAQSTYNEAPALAELVSQGALPPVAERLPANPLVVEPWESIGQYGGTWNMVVRNVPHDHVYELLQYEPLLRFSMGGTELLPNVADEWEVNEDSSIFTFHIREGIKWSDGAPMTADDIVFWVEDVVGNTDLYPAFPTWMTAGGERPTVEKVDDYTIRFSFSNPAPFFLRQMGYPRNEVFRPKHYLQQFHADYTDAAELAARVEEAGLEDWTQLFLNEENREISTGLPVLFAWDLETYNEEGNVYVRNPYYFKVDPEGNQLPYIDTVYTEVVRDLSVAQLKVFSGEAELQTFSVGQFPRDTLALKQGEQQGGFKVIAAPISEPNIFVFGLNLNHKDPIQRELYLDRRFRIALSHAINREEIRQLIYLGQPKEIRQCAPLPESPFYHEAAAKNYTEYDPDEANRLLDEMGLTERDGNGYRLRSDGQPISIAIETRARRDDFVDTLELVAGWWQAVGINASVKPEDDTLFATRLIASEMDANVDFCEGGFLPVISPTDFIPVTPGCAWAAQWGTWYATRGESGEEPTEEVKQQLALFDELLITPDEEQQKALWAQIMDIHAEQLYHMGICDRAPVPVPVSDLMRNVPDTGWNIAWEAGNMGTTNPSQYYKVNA